MKFPADKAVMFTTLVSILIVIGICFLVVKHVERRGYKELSYSEVVRSEFNSTANYAAIAARNTLEIGFLHEAKKTRITLFQLFFSDEKIKGLDCRDRGSKFKCYQLIDMRKGDMIYKKQNESILCNDRACYVLVAEDKKAELSD